MKIAVPILSKATNSPLSLRFGRSPFFAIISDNIVKTEIIENPYQNIKTGIAIGINELLIMNHKIDTIIAYEVGLKIQQIANKNKIRLVILNTKNKNLNDIIQFLKKNNK